MATLYKRGEAYYAQYSINGRQYRTSLRTKDEVEAQKRLDGLLSVRDAEPAISTPEHYPDSNKEWPAVMADGTDTCKGWLRVLYSRTRDRAKNRGIKFYLTIEDLVKIGVRSGGYCEVSGHAFHWARPGSCLFPPFAPSLDRITPQEGYFIGNCRLVCYGINVALSDWGTDVFEVLAKRYFNSRGFHLRQYERP